MPDATTPHLFVLRHGETAWSRDRKHTGRTDIELTDRGRAEAAAAGSLLQQLHPAPFALVLSSPLRRASDTALIAGFDPTLDDHLLEWDYGAYEGRTTDDIHGERPGWVLWRDGCPGGEDADAVGARVDALLAGPVVVAGGDVLLVAHSHLLRVLTARALTLPPTDGAHFVLDPAGVGVIGAEHGIATLLHWNLAGRVEIA